MCYAISMATKEGRVIPVVFAIDDRYAPMLHVTIRSIIANANPDDQYRFHILYENLSKDYQKSLKSLEVKNVSIEFSFIGDKLKKYAEIMHFKYYGSNAIYYRVFIPELFPDYDKVVYLDADIVANANVADFYDTDLGDNYIGGVLCEIFNGMPVVTEYAKKFLGLGKEGPCYFNSGVLLMNCKKMREVNFIKQFFEVANSFKLEICPDQDYYNLLCYGKTVLLPAEWNKMPLPGSKQKLQDVKMVHFNVTGKPWQQRSVLYDELFWEHAKHTPVYEMLLKMHEEAPNTNVGIEKVKFLAGIAKELSLREENLLEIIHKRNYEFRIPKKLHYIWLGGNPITPKIQSCIESWRKKCPDFEIIEWNESNFDLNKSPLIKEALAKKDYALASDIMRVFILNEHGGVYLDTDVEVLKPIDRFMQHELFLGYECKFWVSTAVIGGIPGHPVFQALAKLCASKNSLKITSRLSVHMWSAILARMYHIRARGKTKLLDNGIGIYSKEWFYPIHYITRKKVILPNTHTIHYYEGTWGNEKRLGFFGKICAAYFNSPIYRPVEKMTARGYRGRINRLLKKVDKEN